MRLKRLAIVTYWAPPEGNVASHRVLRLTRALLRAGHEVHWVTLDSDRLDGSLDPTLVPLIPGAVKRHGLGGPCLIAKTAAENMAERVLRTLAFKIPEWFGLPDGYFEWTHRIRRHLARIVREQKIDTVYFCLGPHGALLTIPRLRRQFPDLAILVDYRDLLSGNTWRESGREAHRGRLLARERRALASSDTLFVNTDEARKRLLQLVQPPSGFPVHVMRNAADYELGAQLAKETPPPDFGEGIHIGYFGTVFPRRRLKPILAGLNALEPELAARVRFHLFVWPDSADLTDDDVEALGGHAAQSVVRHEYLPYGEAFAAMRAMDALVLVNSASEDDRIFVPGKLYDYLMARRPVIFAGGQGDAWDIVAHCCGEEWCSRHDEPERLAAMLRRLAERRPDDIPTFDEYGPDETFAPLLDMLID